MKFLEKLPTNKEEASVLLREMQEELNEINKEWEPEDEEAEKEIDREYALCEGRLMIAERIFDLMFGLDLDQIYKKSW
jgi:hypothetical protein